jgi:hypothetical protein
MDEFLEDMERFIEELDELLGHRDSRDEASGSTLSDSVGFLRA